MKTPFPQKRSTRLDRIVTLGALFYVLGVGVFIHLDAQKKEERQALRYKAIEMTYLIGKIVAQIESIVSPLGYRLTSKGVNGLFAFKGRKNWHYELSLIATHQWVIDIRETPSMEMAMAYLPFLDNNFSAVANKKRLLKENRLYQSGTNVWHFNVTDLFTPMAK